MRLSTAQLFSAGLKGILDAQRDVSSLQSQIASGKRVQSPADDPVAASEIISVKKQLSITEQYRKNAAAAEARLQVEETTLRSIENTMQRVRELAIQAGDVALGFTDRRSLAVELDQRLNELLGLVNTRDVNDQYLFGGFQSDKTPFLPASGGGFNYAGDEGQLFIKISDSLDVPVSDSGKSIFLDVDEPQNFAASVDAGNTGAGVIVSQAVSNQNEFDQFYPDGATITFNGVPLGYTVTRVSDGAVISGGEPPQPLAGVVYQSGEAIEFAGMTVSVTGIPDAGDTVNLTSSTPTKLGMLEIVEKLANGIRTIGDSSDDQRRLEELIADTLIGVDNVSDNLNSTLSSIGARLNTIDDSLAIHDSVDLISRQTLSEIEDLDYASAVSNLTQATFVLEAAQQTFVRVSNLTLFNFLR